MPLGDYKNWDDCKADGKSDKYCGFLYHNASPHADEKANEAAFHRFINRQIHIVKKIYAQENEWDVGIMYGMPEKIDAEGKKIKGTLAYAGVSRNGRLYLPEELKKGHGLKLPLILNHGTTEGAESELYRLPPEFREALEQHRKVKIGEILLTWSDENLTLSYEAVITHEFFQNEVIEANMSVSLGILYDADSPKICNEQCYTVIKGAEFQEVSLVYHPGFPIATIEAAEAFLKKESNEAFKIESKETKIPATITFGNDGSQFTFTGTFDNASTTTATEQITFSTNGTADLDVIIPSKQKTEKNPNINVNTYKPQKGENTRMPSKKHSNEAEDQIEPTGELPANKPVDVPDSTSGTAGGGNCTEGQIWNAETEKCEESDTGDASVRSIPDPIAKASVSTTGEAETVAGVKYAPIAGSPDPDDNTSGVQSPVIKKEADLAPDGAIASTEQDEDEPKEDDKNPFGNKNENPFGDIKSERKRTEEYLKKLEQLEAVSTIKVHEARVQAKELKARELRAEQAIKSAKESARKQLSVNRHGATESAGKISANEAEVAKPAAWWKAVVAEENVIPSFIWKINKENLYEAYGKKYMKAFDANENELKLPIPAGKTSGTEAVTGPPDTMRVMSELVLVLPSGKVVTPIRQFCETKILPPGTREAFFYDFGPVNFAAITEDGTTVMPESSPANIIRSSGTNAGPRGTKLTFGYTQLEESPIDIISAANRAYALESINDESVEMLDVTFDDDTVGSGTATVRKAKGGGIKDNRWVDGNSGAQITADATGNGLLTFAGLKSAKGVIQDEGLDDSNLIFYTTGKGIRDIIDDANLDTYIGYSRPAVITEATIERIAGCNLVRTSATAPTTQAVAGDSRSVLFIPNVAFGLISGRDLTMEAQRRNELQSIFLTGTQRIAGVVKNVEATVRVSHL